MYIITGGAGFLGSAMLWKLNTLGIENILVVDNLATSEKWKNLVNRRYQDYLHRDAFLELMQKKAFGAKVKGIIHMGACSSTTERDADFLMRNNLEYSKSVCLFAASQNARFIHASSAATYGNGSFGFDDDPALLDKLKPLNMYGYSKHLFDLWARRTGALDTFASLKFFNVYGPNEQHKGDMRSMVNKAFHQISKNGKVHLFKSAHPDYPDGGQLRDFIYVKDCVDIIWWLLQIKDANGIFNVGTGQARTWNDLVAAVFHAMRLPMAIDYVDMPASLAGTYQNFTEACMDRLHKAGYCTPMHSLEQGVVDYVQQYLQSPDAHL